MRIALLGGTGDIGEGLALRWAQDTDHTIVIGSRNEEKAQKRAEDYRETLDKREKSYDIEGKQNVAATEGADVVVVSVPPEYVTDTVDDVADALDDAAILVSPAVRMNRDSVGFHYDPPEIGSVAEEIAAAAPDHVPVVGGFQNVAAGALTNLDAELSADIIVTGDDDEPKEIVADLAEEIAGIRALDGGQLGTSALVESVTPLLINLAMNNDGMHDLGVTFQ